MMREKESNMPFKSAGIKIEKTEFDARIKISPEMRTEILEERGKLSQRATARKYGISRSSVRFIWMPEKRERARQLYKERRKDGRYYKRARHTMQMRRHRARKQFLYKEGLIKLKEQIK